MAQPQPSLVKHPVQPAQAPAVAQNGAAPPAGAQFTPRREFIRDHRIASSFSLLALSGSGFVRLYSFSSTVVSALKRLFDHRNLISSVREHAPKHFFEFTLEGKPWSNPKSITAEKLIIDILTIILHCGHIFLSTIDYGREQDDKLAITFSKPQLVPNTIPTSFPLSNGSAISLNQPVVKTPFAISFSSATLLRVVGPPLHSTPAVLQAVRGAWPRGVVSEKKVGDATYEFKLKGYKWFQEDTFATDSLHHILGLLTALDTHGFSLLTSLNLASRSRVKDLWIFTGEHHPDSQPSSPSASNTDLRRTITPQRTSIAPGPSPLSLGADKRSPPRLPIPAGLSNGVLTSESPLGHSRHSSEPLPGGPSPPLQPPLAPFAKVQHALRKSPPKTQIPVAFVPDHPETSAPPVTNCPSIKQRSRSRRSSLASFSPSKLVRSLSNPSSIGSVDMTGIGAGRRKSVDMQRTPDVFYATDGRQNTPLANKNNPYFPPLRPNVEPPHAAFLRGHDRSASQDSKADSRHSRPSYLSRSSTLPILNRQGSASSNPQIQVHAPSPISAQGSGHALLNGDAPFPRRDDKTLTPPRVADAPRTPTPPLLTPGTFRDSAFSSATGWQSQEIPIAWTGRGPDPSQHERERARRESSAARDPRGAGDSTRHDGRHEPHFGAGKTDAGAGAQPPPAGDVGPPPAFPPTIREHPSQEGDDHAPWHTPRPPRPADTHDRRILNGSPPKMNGHAHTTHMPSGAAAPPPERESRPATTRRDTAMSGWVMVNVAPDERGGHGGAKKAGSHSPPPSRPAVRQRRSHSESRLHANKSPVGNAPAPATMSAAAKTIAIIDAVDAKEREQAKSSTPSGLKRIFHRTKPSDGDAGKGTPARRPDGGISKRRSLDGMERDGGAGVKDKLKMRATPAATTRPSDKRLTLD